MGIKCEIYHRRILQRMTIKYFFRNLAERKYSLNHTHTYSCYRPYFNTLQIKVKVSNSFQCHHSGSYQKAEQSSDSGCALSWLPFSFLSPLPCRLSPPQTFAPWAQADQGFSSCCCPMLSCHPGQQAPPLI